MPTLNDEKYRALRTVIATGTVNDMEVAYLKDLLVGDSSGLTLDDLWHAFWDEDVTPILPGNFNDRATQWLGTKAITTGVLSERWKAYWETVV